MERVIKLLVEYDKEGQKIVSQAQEQRQQILSHIEDHKKELQKEYADRAGNRIAIVEQAALAEREEKIAELRTRHAAQLEKLRAEFEQNNAQWAAGIVSRSIGG